MIEAISSALLLGSSRLQSSVTCQKPAVSYENLYLNRLISEGVMPDIEELPRSLSAITFTRLSNSGPKLKRTPASLII